MPSNAAVIDGDISSVSLEDYKGRQGMLVGGIVPNPCANIIVLRADVWHLKGSRVCTGGSFCFGTPRCTFQLKKHPFQQGTRFWQFLLALLLVL